MSVHLAARHGRHRPRPWRKTTVAALISVIRPSLKRTGTRHARLDERPESGLDETFVDTLHDWNTEDTEAAELAAQVAIEGWDRAMLMPTEPIPAVPAEPPTVAVEPVAAPADIATEVAFQSAARHRAQDASDTRAVTR